MMSNPSSQTGGVAGRGMPEAQQQLQDLQVILAATRAMGSTMGLDDLLVLILNSVRDLLDAERATLFLFDASTHELVSKIAHGTGEIRLPANAGIAGAAAQTRTLINIPDAYADPRFNPEIDRQTGFQTRCLLTVPLTGAEGKLVGVLQVLNKKTGTFNGYDEQLAEALAAQAGVALQRATLMEHYVQKKQLEQSLAIAREIQQGLLPRNPPTIPGYDIAGWCLPADQTGGDCFDFIPRSDGQLAICVADASGHGIGSALRIAETRALLRAISGQVDQAEEVLAGVNRWLCADELESRFVTAVYAILDPARHVLDHASAGHGPMFWYRAADQQVTISGATGLPLGAMDEMMIGPAPRLALQPGDLGLFVTDGIVECANRSGTQLGNDRVGKLLKECANRPAAAILDTLRQAAVDFAAGIPQLDDMTAVIVKRV